MLSIKQFFRSFYYAGRGIVLVWKNEQSFRLQTLAALVVIFLMIFFQVKLWEAIILILVIISVLVLEMLNSIIERIIDVFKPRLHPYVQEIKDIAAAAVLAASLGALLVGLIIFLPYFFQK